MWLPGMPVTMLMVNQGLWYLSIKEDQGQYFSRLHATAYAPENILLLIVEQCDNRQPQCWNCERSRLYECDGYEGVEPRPASSPSIFSVMDNVLAVDNDDFGDPNIGWTEFNDTIEQQPQVSEMTRQYQELLDGSPFQVFQGVDAQSLLREPGLPAPLVDLGSREDVIVATEDAPLTTLNLEALPAAVRELLDHYRTHVCGLMMPTTAPSRNPWLHLYLPLALKGPPSSPNEALLYGILSVSAYNRANLTPEKRDSFFKLGKEYSEKASATLRSVLKSSEWVFDLEKHVESSHALMAACLTLTTIEVRLDLVGFHHGFSDGATRSSAARVRVIGIDIFACASKSLT